MNDIEKWIAAKQMIDMFGDNAGLQAAMRSDHLLDQGDREGARVWKLIVDAIQQLQMDKPEDSRSVH